MSRPLSILIVNWNSGSHLKRQLESLVHCGIEPGWEILIADNASRDGSAGTAAISGAPVRLIKLPENLGFAGAANRLAAEARAPWLLFLNPDICHRPGAILCLIREVGRRPEFAGGCGRLVYPDGRSQHQFQFRRLPGPAWALAELFLPPGWRRLAGLHRLQLQPVAAAAEPVPVEQPAAACLLIKRHIFDELQGFDEAFYPAWFEDVDFAKRLQLAGHRLLYVPAAIFEHAGGYSAQVLPRAEFLRIYWHNARRYYVKHHGRFGRFYRRIFPAAARLRALFSWHDPASRAGWRALARTRGNRP